MGNTGKSESTQGSRPLSAGERQAIYRAALGNVKGAMPEEGSYHAPGYKEQDMKTLSGGDYDQLEQNLLESRMAPINRAKELDIERVNQSLSDRGLWSSGIAVEAENDVAERYAPVISQAGGEATAARYNMQADELGRLNQFAMAREGQENTFNSEQALREYDARWRPADYLAGLWNGTGGTVSSGSSSGWSI